MDWLDRCGWGGLSRAFWRVAFVGLLACGMAGCGYDREASEASEAPRPQQAGKAVDPYAVVGHTVGVHAAVLMGDGERAERHVRATARNVARSARIRDVHRPIDRETARGMARAVPGVRSAVWLDAENLIVMVDGQQYRSLEVIDRVCVALEPLGDTLGVVVNVQDARARNGDEAMTLSRNCQLPVGERAFMQAKRQVDVVSPQLREEFKRQQR